MSKKIYISLIFSIVVGFVLKAQTAYDKKLQSLYSNTVPQVKPSEVQVQMRTNGKIILLDTRSPEEYQISHIPGATFIDYKKFAPSDVQYIDRNAEVIVYCTVGYRSEKVGEKLLDMGFTNVKNLYGGIFQWANEGRLLLNRKNQPTDSVHTYSWWWSSWLERGVKVH